jgi:hypothetical protein
MLAAGFRFQDLHEFPDGLGAIHSGMLKNGRRVPHGFHCGIYPLFQILHEEILVVGRHPAFAAMSDPDISIARQFRDAPETAIPHQSASFSK